MAEGEGHQDSPMSGHKMREGGLRGSEHVTG